MLSADGFSACCCGCCPCSCVAASFAATVAAAVVGCHTVIVAGAAGVCVIADAIIAAVALENPLGFQMLTDVQCDVALTVVPLTGGLKPSPTETTVQCR